MADMRAEVDAIANNPAPPSFDNTIVALERSGRLLSRASSLFFSLSGANSNPDMLRTARTLAPKLAAHNDAIRLDPKLFARIETLYQTRATLGLDQPGLRVLERYRSDFVRAGAQLSDADKAQAARAEHRAGDAAHHVLAERAEGARGLGRGLRQPRRLGRAWTRRRSAPPRPRPRRRGWTAGSSWFWATPHDQAAMVDLQSHAARVRLMQASLARGSHGGEFDNRAVVLATARKRAERAALLGYPNHAAYELQEQTIGSVDVLNRLLAQMAGPAVANARREAAQMQTLIDADKGGYALDAADWPRYAEKVRAARYAFDEAQLKPYFELDHVLIDGVFYAAGRLYGLTFKERHDLPVYEPSVRVFDVFEADGKQLAIFLVDYYARPNKNGGAWANDYVWQDALTGARPVIANHLNIPKPAPGQPTLLTQGRGRHRLPRIRPRLARHVPERGVPAPGRRAARLRRIPVAGQRDVGLVARGVAALRPPLPDWRAAAAGAGGQGDCRGQVQPGLQDHRIPGCDAAGPGLAPGQGHRPARGHRCAGLRGRGAEEGRAGLRAGAAALPQHVLLAHLRRRLLGGLLRLHLERGAGC